MTGLLSKAGQAKNTSEMTSEKEKIQVEVAGSYGLDGKIDKNELNKNLKHINGLKYNNKDIVLDGDNKNIIEQLPAEVFIDNNSFFIDENGDVLDWKYADLINSKIGNIVERYSAADLEWQVFYADPVETYLISKTLAMTGNVSIPLTRSKKNEEEEYSYTGSEDVKKLEYGAKWNKKWLNKCITENKNTSAKAAAYMCDPVNWREYIMEGITNYAVGGPTIDLLIASYNKSQGTNVELSDEDVNSMGASRYKPDELGKSGALSWKKNNGVYCPGFQQQYKIATPGNEYGDRFILVGAAGTGARLERAYYWQSGIRPIVSIPTSKISINEDTVIVNP